MTNKQDKLQRIVDVRRKYMRKDWKESSCEFSYKTYVEITFLNSDSDFVTTRYPDIDTAIEKQQEKLGKDIISFVGSDNMDEVKGGDLMRRPYTEEDKLMYLWEQSANFRKLVEVFDLDLDFTGRRQAEQLKKEE